MNVRIDEFINDYSKNVMNHSASIFLGAGFSSNLTKLCWDDLMEEYDKYLRDNYYKKFDLIKIRSNFSCPERLQLYLDLTGESDLEIK